MGNRHGGGGIMRLRQPKAAAEEEEREEKQDLGSYEAACCADPELGTFNAALRRRASRVVSAVASGVEVRSMSLGSLREVTSCLVEMNQDVVRVVLACKRDVWRSPELFDLVEDYLDASIHTFDFLAALDKSLHRARDSQLVLHLTLQRLEHHHHNGGGGGNGQEPPALTGAAAGDQFARTLCELRKFKATGDPFADELFATFQAVYRQQLAMLEKLRQRKRRLDQRLRAVHTWRRVTGIVFVTAFAAILIRSVVAAHRGPGRHPRARQPTRGPYQLHGGLRGVGGARR